MDICFVSLPFVAIERPLISFGLLQAILKKENIKATTLYYNLDFAEKIGAYNYHVMSQCAYILLGEWVFSPSLFPGRTNADDYLNKLKDLLQKAKTRPLPLFNLLNDRDYLLKLRNIAHSFLKDAAEEVVEKYNPRIVACSSIFDNHIACVSFLKFIKAISPETITMIGGQNCESEMGKTTHKLFPFVDYVVSGHADHLITELCKKIFTYGKNIPIDEVPGQVFAPIFREKEYELASRHLEPHINMRLTELPIPDYTEYFEKINRSSELKRKILPAIPVESSRGCYWGKCKFCGLNSEHLDYKQKNWEQVYHEIATLTKEYKIRKIEFVDNAIHFKQLSDMFDALINHKVDLQIFAEVRVQIKKEQLKKMKEAGVIWMQPGIESLNDNFLKCMNKGSTMLQNIQLMKWARQYGVHLNYNIMHCFPFEKDEWFSEIADIIPFIIHLQPPRSMNKLRFDRFSDYYKNQSKYGLDLKALEFYSHIYPYDQPTLNNLAYFFEDKKDYSMRKTRILYNLFGNPKKSFHKVGNIVNDWMKSFYSKCPFRLTYEINENNIVIYDTRPISVNNNIVLNKLEGEIFLFTDEVKSIEKVNNTFGPEYKSTDIENSVQSLIDKKVVIKHKDNILAVAVESPVPNLSESNDFPCGIVIKDC